MQRPRDPFGGPPGRDDPELGATLIQLPVRARTVSPSDAAAYLGISHARLRILRLFGTGPARPKADVYRIDDLDAYVALLYTRGGIGPAERARHLADARDAKHAQAPIMTGAGMRALRHHADRAPIPDFNAFMTLATGREMIGHGIFFLLKAMALFGFIMLCLSSTPLLKTHFG